MSYFDNVHFDNVHFDNVHFRPTDDAKKEYTKNILYRFLDEWNLKPAFMQNKISMSVDGALYPHVREMYTDNNLYPAVTICFPHNFGRVSKRTLDNNLKRHWPEGPEKINVSFLTCL